MPKTSYMPPETSVGAYKEVKAKSRDNCHREIVYKTLLKLRNRTGTATDIAMHCTLDYYEVNRRVKELIKENRIYILSEKGGRSMADNPCRIYRAVEKQMAGTGSSGQEQKAGAGDRVESEKKIQGALF